MKNLLLSLIGFLLINAANAQDIPASKADTSSITIDGDAPYLVSSTHDRDLEQKNTSFIYPGYIIKIHDFNVFNEENGMGNFNYNGDTSQVILNIPENLLQFARKETASI